MSVPFRPLGNRVVIRADIEDHAPEEKNGILLAKTLAAAVEGSDAEDSWFVGTVVALGPLVNRFELRPWLLRRLDDLCDYELPDVIGVADVLNIRDALQELPAECPDPLKVGDRVTFSWASGQQISVDGEKFLIMDAKEVLAVLEESHA